MSYAKISGIISLICKLDWFPVWRLHLPPDLVFSAQKADLEQGSHSVPEFKFILEMYWKFQMFWKFQMYWKRTEIFIWQCKTELSQDANWWILNSEIVDKAGGLLFMPIII